MCESIHFPLKEQMSVRTVLSHHGICTKAASVVSMTRKETASPEIEIQTTWPPKKSTNDMVAD